MKVPVTLLTGFLGSGKTTLLNRWLKQPELANTVVIVNEFGEIGLDHDLIESADDSVVLLANGCLCCAMRGDLVRALDDVYRQAQAKKLRPFDRIIIETSGLADPGPLVQLVLSEPSLKQRFVLDRVLTTVDAVNAGATLAAHGESRRQVALADALLMTKLDLLEASEAATVLKVMTALNPTAEILDARECDSPVRLLLEGDVLDSTFERAIERHAASLSDAALHQRNAAAIDSFSLVLEQPFSPTLLELFLQGLTDSLGARLLRVKGILNVMDEPAVVHGVQQLLHNLEWRERWPSDDHRSRIVFITEGPCRDTVEALLEFLDRMARRKPPASGVAASSLH